jgi:hypothetical protein
MGKGKIIECTGGRVSPVPKHAKYKYMIVAIPRFNEIFGYTTEGSQQIEPGYEGGGKVSIRSKARTRKNFGNLSDRFSMLLPVLEQISEPIRHAEDCFPHSERSLIPRTRKSQSGVQHRMES